MKIAMILDQEFPPDPRVQNEAESLINDGHSIFLLCLDYSNKLPNEKVGEIEVVRFSFSKFVYKLSSLAYSFPLYRWILSKKIRKFLLSQKFDAIHVHDMRIGKTVLSVTKDIKVPKVLDLHENRPEIMRYYEHVRKFPGNVLIYPKWWKRWEKKLVRKFDYCIVVTDEAKKYLVRNHQISGNKVFVYSNTVHKHFYTNYTLYDNIVSRMENKFTLLYIGDTGKRRGLETAIYGVEKLIKSIPNLLLVIVGKSKYDDKLKQLVSQLELNNYVSFEGYQNIDLFQSYILSSNIGISPFHRNIHHDTTFANKIFQYMSLGLPVLASNCTAQKNIIEKAQAGIIHNAKDIDDFENKVLQLFNNTKLAKQLGDNGKAFIRNEFNQEIKSFELLSLYQRL